MIKKNLFSSKDLVANTFYKHFILVVCLNNFSANLFLLFAQLQIKVENAADLGRAL